MILFGSNDLTFSKQHQKELALAMRKSILLLLLLLCVKFVHTQTRVLVFSKTNGFRHVSIPDGQEMFKKLAKENNWKLTLSEDSLVINKRCLSKIDVLVFLSTSGQVLGAKERDALQKYIHKGGGFVAIHGAAATERNWPWYVDMVGGILKNHPKPQNATLHIKNSDFKATQHLGKTWKYFDEWYNFKDPISANCVVLATVDESTYTGGTMGAYHPVVWYQNFEGGKIFTNVLGHTKESYTNPDFVQLIKEGVIWAGGK